jgi:uncharacterized iron-regulated membrane protein
MGNRALRRWALVHKWTSLICTVFLLVLCVTGLPLIFREEIDDWLYDDQPYATLPAATPIASLDSMVETARHRHPDQAIWYVFVDDDEPKVVVGLLPSPTADAALGRFLKFDSRTGELLKEVEPRATRPAAFLEVMLRLHRDLLIDLPGELFLAAMGLLFIAATVSGIVLYAPFAGRQRFGTVRSTRSVRLKWLDLHNLLGVTTLAWVLVVGMTGVLNELAQPLFLVWQRTDVQAMLQPYRGLAVPQPGELSSVQQAFDTVRQALPQAKVTSVLFPGGRFGSPYHFLIWTKGGSALTSRLFSPVLVDARTGAISAIVEMPWYLRAVEISRPLHFGDYGGVPLKVIWALLDVATIAVLVSGLYLWLQRRQSPIEARLAELRR